MANSRKEYFQERRKHLKMVSVMIERDVLDQLDNMLHCEGTTRSKWIRQAIYDKVGHHNTSGLAVADSGVLATCKHCGRTASTIEEVNTMFGWHQCNGRMYPLAICSICRMGPRMPGR